MKTDPLILAVSQGRWADAASEIVHTASVWRRPVSWERAEKVVAEVFSNPNHTSDFMPCMASESELRMIGIRITPDEKDRLSDWLKSFILNLAGGARRQSYAPEARDRQRVWLHLALAGQTLYQIAEGGHYQLSTIRSQIRSPLVFRALVYQRFGILISDDYLLRGFKGARYIASPRT